MRAIILRVVQMGEDPNGQALNYRDEFLAVVQNFPEGISIAQMGDAINVAQKLRSAKDGEKIYLENAEHAYLLARLDGNRFRIAAQELVDMRRALAEAPDVQVPHLVDRPDKKKRA